MSIPHGGVDHLQCYRIRKGLQSRWKWSLAAAALTGICGSLSAQVPSLPPTNRIEIPSVLPPLVIPVQAPAPGQLAPSPQLQPAPLPVQQQPQLNQPTPFQPQPAPVPAQPVNAPAQPAPMQMAQPGAGAAVQPNPGAAQPGAGAAAQPGQLPQPRQLPFGDDRVRMNRMGGPLGTTPVPSPQDLEEARQFVDGVVDPKLTLELIEGRSRLILLKNVPTQTQVADAEIANFTLLSPRQLTILGRRAGTTVLNLWFKDPNDPTKEKVISYLVRVLPDPELKDRLEAVYKALELEINKAYPRSRIKLQLVGDKLMVTGQVHDITEATHILQILRANAPNQQNQGGLNAVRGNVSAPLTNLAPLPGNPNDPTNPNGIPGAADYFTAGGPNVINNMRITGEQQVMLRVVVAEVNRSAARSIGLNFSLTNNQGINYFAQTTGNLLGAGAGAVGAAAGGGNLPIVLNNGLAPIALEALRTLNYARSLAEPTLTALNGQTAFFLAGGQFPVPVLGGIGQVGGGLGGFGGGLQGVQFIPFGVQLSFTPVISDRDRIRLTLQATVSTRNTQTGANIGGTNVPGLTARTFSTTVQLREGQTLAVAGLIQTNLGADSSRVPFLGDIPLLGRVARTDQTSAGEQELVVLVTPELVHPLEANELSHLPGSDLFEPGDLEFYVYGRMESRRSYDYRSPVMTDIHRMLKYRKCEQQYLIGPSGHSEQLLINSAASK